MPIRIGRPGLLATAARTAVIAGTAQAAAGAVARRQAQRYAPVPPQPQPQAQPMPVAPPPPAPAPVAPSAGDDLIAQLERLAQLQAAGALSADEFAAAKAKLLA